MAPNIPSIIPPGLSSSLEFWVSMADVMPPLLASNIPDEVVCVDDDVTETIKEKEK